MKDGLKEIIGKQIATVVVARNDRGARVQVFLVFSDGSNFEFYGDDFTCCAGLDRTADIERYVESANGRIVKVFGDVAALKPPVVLSTGGEGVPYPAQEPLEALLRRDLDAWIAAKAAVEKARRKR